MTYLVQEVEEQVVVLGRAQKAEVTGLPWRRRMSGGGAVLLTPGEVVWVDVELPRAHALWDDDVGRAAWWLGEVWADALGRARCMRRVSLNAVVQAGVLGGIGPARCTTNADCGHAQRRTRERACSSVSQLRGPEPLVHALGLPDVAAGELTDAVIGVPNFDSAALLQRLEATL